ncbi:MAG: DNA/RNA nuclease SfsA [Chloroflexi bacterium]|nr:DNA/RNA nuclease SfsA [Chloroflexota bacterium]
MKLSEHLAEGTFLVRLNRFAALVKTQAGEELVHVANSGRLRELLMEGNRVLLTPIAPRPGRKTRFDLSLVDLGRTLVSADARLPSALVCEALEAGQIPELRGYSKIVREARFEDSRLDLMLTRDGQRCYVEVKSVTLVENGMALFPDAPTTRGQRHVAALARAVQQGWRAAVVFVVQRQDAVAFAPHDSADPAFGKGLRAAHQLGVEVYAYSCAVDLWQISLKERLPVVLDAGREAQTSHGRSAP